jgi:hypothetical protein
VFKLFRHKQPFLKVIGHNVVNQLGILKYIVRIWSVEYLEHDDSKWKNITFWCKMFGLITEYLRGAVGNGESGLMVCVRWNKYFLSKHRFDRILQNLWVLLANSNRSWCYSAWDQGERSFDLWWNAGPELLKIWDKVLFLGLLTAFWSSYTRWDY